MGLDQPLTVSLTPDQFCLWLAEQSRLALRCQMPELVDVDELCIILCCGKTKVYELAESMELPCVKVGGSTRFRRAAVEAYLTGHEIRDIKSANKVFRDRRKLKDQEGHAHD